MLSADLFEVRGRAPEHNFVSIGADETDRNLDDIG
jgi:hypothetical protein